MKFTRVTVQFENGLHARTATNLVKLFKRFNSQVVLKVGNRVANGRSILGILLLAATLSTQIEVQASGQDEEAAISAVTTFFQQTDEQMTTQIGVEGSSPDQGSGESV
jgi:phosphocarrier protein HPr